MAISTYLSIIILFFNNYFKYKCTNALIKRLVELAELIKQQQQ